MNARWFCRSILGMLLYGPPAAMTCERPPDWFNVIRLDEQTWALSEPGYWQANVNYLLVGTERALLFDTGPGVHRIGDVVRPLTALPVIVVPSHLHFDHTGRIHEFDEVALIDLPALRAQVRNGEIALTSGQYMLREPIRFRVTRWLGDGESIDLGGRHIVVVNTPGHTPESVSLVDSAGKRLFVGDLVNRDITLADVPGSDARQMAQSVRRLIDSAPPGSVAWEAHSEKPLAAAELAALADGLARIVADEIQPQASCLGGLPMRRYDIGDFPVLLPAEGDARLAPLRDAVEELQWLTTACLRSN